MAKERLVRSSLLFLVLSTTTAWDDSCGITAGINKAIATIQQAIDTLAQQSEAWQTTLTNLEKDLVKQAQQTISTQVTQLAERGVATGGVELRCDADFVGNRMTEGLTRIIAGLKKQPVPPLTEYFCQAVPTQIDLGLDPSLRQELDFYGYNLDSGGVAVSILNNAGAERPISQPGIIGEPTHYLVTINLSANGIQLLPTDQQILVRINGGKELHPVNIVAPLVPPAQNYSLGTGTPMNIAGGGGSGGLGFGEMCPSGSVGTELQGRVGPNPDDPNNPVITFIQLFCSPLNRDGTLGTPIPVPAHGKPVGNSFDQPCPSGQALIGLTGMTGKYVDKVGSVCKAPTDIATSSGKSTTVGPNGGAGGTIALTPSCGATSVVVGYNGQSGDVLDHINIFCQQILQSPAGH